MNKQIKELTIKFADEVNPLEPFNEKNWFRDAYQTMQRTKKGGTSKEQKEEIRNLVFTEIKKMKNIEATQECFDKWFYDVVNNISKIGQLTFGQSQKIVNILLKYFYCYYHS
ncbi:hypothetical protein [Tepidibacter sp. Z1-5]|uniref:hypothetical protein n=1 Tax=Tepidibacter sp. Z1-5 TaxID=3134138 RepID=UPI0030BAF496